MVDINELRAMLQTGIVQLAFVKRDKTVRNMRATLNAALITYEYKNSDAKRNDNVTCVWDVDKQAWRSLRNDMLLCYVQA